MSNFKARISKLEKNIKPRKKLYKIYWADGTFVGEYRVSSKEAKCVSNALKNLKQRYLNSVDEENILITCAKDQWYNKHNKPAAFSKGSRAEAVTGFTFNWS